MLKGMAHHSGWHTTVDETKRRGKKKGKVVRGKFCRRWCYKIHLDSPLLRV
jgi:hypothetical protein